MYLYLFVSLAVRRRHLRLRNTQDSHVLTPELFGVNIFDYDWKTTGKRVKVQDPVYHQDHTFEVWQVEINGQIHRFAAGEFSNSVW